MKLLSLALISSLAISVLANETFYMTPGQREQCENIESFGGHNVCCEYSNCRLCGFYQRCCLKDTGSSQGSCECGVNSHPQGHCYWNGSGRYMVAWRMRLLVATWEIAFFGRSIGGLCLWWKYNIHTSGWEFSIRANYHAKIHCPSQAEIMRERRFVQENERFLNWC